MTTATPEAPTRHETPHKTPRTWLIVLIAAVLLVVAALGAWAIYEANQSDDLTFTPGQWEVEELPEGVPATRTSIGMPVWRVAIVADVRPVPYANWDGSGPVTVDDIQGITGRFIWEETEARCEAGIRGWSLRDSEPTLRLTIGSVFESNETCQSVADAFQVHGPPETGCLVVRTGGADHEYCAPLS